MKQQFQDLFTKIKPALTVAQRYLVFGVFLIFGAIYASLILRVNHLSGLSPTQVQIDSQLQTTQPLKVDPATLDKIQQLQNENIQVQSLFDQARQNPFAE
jgi:hypothetical protein